MIERMGVTLIADIAKTSLVTVFMAAFGCILAAGFAIPMSATPGQPGAAAFRLAKGSGLVGGVAAIVCGMTSTLYFRLVGQASPRAFLLVELALIGAAVVTALTVAVILSPARSRSD
jgi:hypothetical protein